MDHIDDTTEYWLYIISEGYWDDYLKRGSEYIGSIIKYNVLKNAIIIIYCNTKKLGFCGLLHVCEDLHKSTSDKIKPFTDMNLNKYVVKIDEKIILNEPIGIKDIICKVVDNCIGFKSTSSFISRYIRGKIEFVHIDRKTKGKLIFEEIKKYVITFLYMLN